MEYNLKDRDVLKIKAECYERMGKEGEFIDTLRKISESGVIDDDAVEFLFEYMKDEFY